MLYDMNSISEVNPAYLVTSLNNTFKTYQSGEPDRACPLVNKAWQSSDNTITMNTQEAALSFEIEFNDYSASLSVYDPELDTTTVLLAGAIENGQNDFEEEFANGCLLAIMAWW